MFKVIKASAGSGKTYQLTLNYLKHLSRGNRPDASVIRSILAITFTNKAAAEMKHRIVKALKEIALGTPMGLELGRITGISKDNASQWLDIIIRNYDDFRIQTIDSFVFHLLQTMAWEMRIRPDAEPELNTDRVLGKAFDRLLLKMGNDEHLERIFGEALRCFLELENASGFNPEKHFRKNIRNIFETAVLKVASSSSVNRSKYALLSFETLKDLKERAAKIAQEILAICERDKIQLYNKAKDAFEKFVRQDGQKDPGNSEYFRKSSISKFVKQSKKPLDLSQLDQLYQKFKESFSEYLLAYAIVRIVPYANLLSELTKEIEAISSSEGIILSGQWTRMVLEHLRDHVPAVYFSLGERLKHFLIDEFQDTSREQWETLFPLIENALSEGGSLIYVGDPKQSIYIWRQADPALFSEAMKAFPSVQPDVETLRINWRSTKEIVEFNNTLFSSLDETLLETVVKKYLGISEEIPRFARDDSIGLSFRGRDDNTGLSFRGRDDSTGLSFRGRDENTGLSFRGTKCRGISCDIASDDFVKRCVQDIKLNFDNVVQELPDSCHGTSTRPCGSVETIIIKGSKKGDRKVEIKEKLIERISNFVSSGVPLSDITVLTRTNEQIKFVFSWLWEAGIPAVTEHSLRIEKSPTIKAVVNFLKFIHDPKDESSLVGFLQSDLARGLNDVECFDESWIFEAHDKNLSLFKYIREFHQDVYNSVFAPFIERAGYETAYDLARWVIQRFDVRRRFPEESSFVLRFLELINNLEEKLGRFVSLSEFISLWEKEVAEEQLGIPESIGAQLLVSSESDVENNKGAVRIMTIHGAKGLEFPVVILPFLDWDSNNPEVIVLEDGRLARVSKPYPEEVRNAVLKKKKEELIESFNLLYVAFTRARNHLVVMIPGENSPPIAHFLCNFLGLLS